MSKSTIGLRRKGLAGLATATLTMGAVFAGAGIASADADFTFERVAGDTRYETSAEIGAEYGASTNAILASGEDGRYPDALGANYLSGQEDAPVFLTETDNLPAEVLAQLKANGVDNVTIVGGLLAVSQAVEDELVAEGFNVTREAGQTRWETNQEIIAAGGDADSTVGLVTTGNNFPDALAVGPLAYKGGHAIGLSDGGDMPDATIDAMKAAGVTQALVVGGPLAVPQSVIDELNSKGITVLERLARTTTGQTNRSGTAAAVAEYAVENLGFSVEGANVASGRAFGDGADALAGGPLTGKQNRPLLITENESIAGSATLQYLREHACTLSEGMMFGGPLAITNALKTELETAARSCETNQDFSVDPADMDVNPTGAEHSYTADVLATGADEVTVALVDADFVTDTDGVITFRDANNDDEADGLGITDAEFTEINDVAQPAGADLRTVDVAADGTVTFTITSDTDETDVRPVVFVGDEDDATVLVLDADNEPTGFFGVGGEKLFANPDELVVTPATDVNPYGTNHTVAATLATNTDIEGADANGIAVPVAGETIEFTVAEATVAAEVTSCDLDWENLTLNQFVTDGEATTNDAGTAAFTFSGPADPSTADDDDTVYCVLAQWTGAEDSEWEGLEADGTAEKTWTDDEPMVEELTVSQDEDVNLFGTTHAVSATLTDQFGNPVAGESVDFTVTRDAATVVERTRTTNTDGVATFSYQGPPDPDPTNGDAAVTDTIEAVADQGNTDATDDRSDSVDKTWAEGVASVGDDEYATLQAAVNNADEGDTVTAVGDFTENVLVAAATEGVTLQGDDATLYGNLQVRGDDTTVDGFAVIGGGIVVNGAGATTADPVTVTVSNNEVDGNGASNGILFDGDGAAALADGVITGNTVTDVEGGIIVSTYGDVEVSDNTISDFNSDAREAIGLAGPNTVVTGNAMSIENGEAGDRYILVAFAASNTYRQALVANNTFDPAAEVGADGNIVVAD